MSDERDRFRELDLVDPPDVWQRAQRLAPQPPRPEVPPLMRRAGIAALALALGMAGVLFGVRALETPSDGCCDHIVSDGTGGVWMLGELGGGRVRVWHLTAEGEVHGMATVDVPANHGGIAAALDPEAMTFWIVETRDTVTPLRIRSA